MARKTEKGRSLDQKVKGRGKKLGRAKNPTWGKGKGMVKKEKKQQVDMSTGRGDTRSETRNVGKVVIKHN